MICTMCGYLEIDDMRTRPAGDPMREPARDDRDAPRARGRCPGCCNDAWADPRLEATAMVLRGTQSRELAADETPERSYGAAVAQIVFALGMLAWLLWAASHPSRGSQVGFAALASALGIVVASKGIYEAIASVRIEVPQPIPPARWHLALPVATHMRGEAHGAARPLDGLLSAPLTGRPCIAYELGVLTDVDHSSGTATWLLREQRSAAFAVGTTTFPPNAVRLQGGQEVLDPRRLDRGHVHRVLGERAFSFADTGLVLVETLVEAGDVVTVRSAPASFGGTFWEMPTVVVQSKTRALSAAG